MVGWSRYEISNMGRVRRCAFSIIIKRKDGNIVRRTFKAQLVKLSTHLTKYFHFSANDGMRRKNVLVHVQVALAFLGPRPNGLFVCHNNGNCQDNRVINLAYKTHSENMLDKILHGTSSRGQRHHHVRLTAEIVLLIRASDLTDQQLAKQYGVAKETITRARSGHTWYWLKPETHRGGPKVKRQHQERKVTRKRKATSRKNLAPRKYIKASPEIRKKIKASSLTCRKLAEIYGIPKSTVHYIKSRPA